MSTDHIDRLGATATVTGTNFLVWAPDAERVDVIVEGVSHPLHTTADRGYWTQHVDGVAHGEHYRFSVDGGEALADPASAWQPDGVHGASAVVDTGLFEWSDAEWRGRGLAGSVIYELHVGTFTAGGTFVTAIEELPRLAALGITTIEVMPVGQFAGERNWGYDGVLPYAVQHSYGGPVALAKFVDAAHRLGLAVILDVVDNHVGPEGNVLARYGPYFTDSYNTPWGPAVNVAEAESDGVRRYFIEQACRWITEYHLDGFRFDAVHAVIDPTANPFFEQLNDAVRVAAVAARRTVVLIAESSDNDPRHVHTSDRAGIGFDAVWCDDVHHTLRVALTGDRRGYYVDYAGSTDELADIVEHRWKFRGQYSEARRRRHGRPVDDVAPHRFIACSQNHDQVGNRPAGDRPDYHITPAQRRFLPSTVLLSPYTPMLFMGEEYGERAPFPFFVDHTDPAILAATRAGRRAEFEGADWDVDVPDPGAIDTFRSAILDPSIASSEPHRSMLAMYTRLLHLRATVDPIANPAATQRVQQHGDVVLIARTIDECTSTLVLNAGPSAESVAVDGNVEFDSDATAWGGSGATRAAPGAITVPGFTAVLIVG